MKKKLELIIENTCENCPYCQYNDYCNKKEYSGFDCKHPDIDGINQRIIDDYYLNKNGWPPIIKYCPLPEIM